MTQVLKSNQSQYPLRYEVNIYTAVTYILHVFIRKIQKSVNERHEFLKRRNWFILNQYSPLIRKELQDLIEIVFWGICKRQRNRCWKVGKNYEKIYREMGEKYGGEKSVFLHKHIYRRGETDGAVELLPPTVKARFTLVRLFASYTVTKFS